MVSDIAEIMFKDYRGGLSCLNHFIEKIKF